ncbi:putative type II restriction endonuclease [Lactobacillus amylovorus]|jgi:type I restriction-modification system DNA methylase subunit|uniref:site-specific DNA-methyltransferase (adenine-specific) n=1 Tax=Lactobacillus amylovorus TaxID=1604 RepID=F0TIL1_LACAM|nr:DNA methyltransferase [Lactobacillus amylovorus]ADZ06518.1 putative type II restriction endonuclease [Lactobacillus amylovorus]MDB6222112.1 N-6 DNA methylase [Lactobacillus amylovorus]MDY2786981.1 DNA methyltransferase [Lactobacillus amylovorus]MDY5443951.1 DNA methyltransferase [Lactobacillus amylovorus]
MDITTQKRNAKQFIQNWQNRGHEKQDSQSFWLQLLRDVLGVEEPEQFIKFEKKVQLSHESFIDGYIDQTHVMIEQKGSNKDLDKPIRQSSGELLTPFQQAQRYANNLPYSERPRWIVTCNFIEFRVYDMEHPNSEPVRIELKDLEKNYYQLEFLVDKSNEHLEKEKQVSLSAGELVGKIYDELLKQYKDPNNEHSQKSINQLCVRIVFCLYAEDAGIFGKRNMFHDYLEQFDVRQMRQALIKLFKVLDTKEEDRDPYLADDDPKLAEFPYVNGGMFSNEDIEIPSFTDELRSLLLSKASDEFDWSEISPTIFGAVFESTLNPETRRQGGMHYTSVENIHKVIDPLFLNDLKNELNEIKKTKQLATLKKKARKFQEKLANLTFFDPACGSGNFLTETYLQLRKLENEAIKLIYPNPSLDVGQAKDIIKVSIQQFYGIEINDFAVSVAKTALWIAESQMLEETKDIFYADWDFLPLKTYTHIHEGNALTMDWNNVIPNYACHYIMGNPPFIGASMMNKEQKEEAVSIFGKRPRTRSIDYVGAWYYKAAKFIQGTEIKCAFVSTNSITEGEQVQPMWSELYNKYHIIINFAYKTFIWTTEAKSKAAVHCVIIGFSLLDNRNKIIFYDDTKECVNQINSYLLDAPNVLVRNRSKPLNKNTLKMTKGNQPSDGGNLLLTIDEKNRVIKKYPDLKEVIKLYLTARDYLHNNNERFCLWFKDKDVTNYNNPFVKRRLELVKQFREKSSARPTREKAQTPYLFFSTPQTNENYLCVPEISSERRRYIPIGFLTGDVIASNKLLIVLGAKLYDLGILESNVHMAWVRTVAGRLKSDYQYSSSVVYNTFPWPTPTDKQKAKIEKTAQAILDARALYPDSSLADLYDPLTMPKELLKAHQDNDRAVMEAYGLSVKGTTESDAVAHLFKMYEKLTKEQ